MRIFQRHSLIVTTLLAAISAQAQDVPTPVAAMSFFVTSTGRGIGGNLGGLAGADALCRQRATAVGRRSAVARLSQRTTISGCASGQRARPDRPRAVGQRARDSDCRERRRAPQRGRNPTSDTALTEKGGAVAPNRHDILTGSNPDGTLVERGDATQRVDEPRRRPGDGGASQSHRRRTRRFLEFRPSLSRLLADCVARFAWRRTSFTASPRIRVSTQHRSRLNRQLNADRRNARPCIERAPSSRLDLTNSTRVVRSPLSDKAGPGRRLPTAAQEPR